MSRGVQTSHLVAAFKEKPPTAFDFSAVVVGQGAFAEVPFWFHVQSAQKAELRQGGSS